MQEKIGDIIDEEFMLKLRVESFRRRCFDFITHQDGKVHEKQQEALQILTDSKTEEFLFGGAAGGAKILANDGVILTPFGWKKGEDLKVGDLVNNPDGSVQRIIAIKDEIYVDQWTVFFRDGTSTDVGKEHLWNAWKGGKGRKISNVRTFGEDSAEVIETSELKEWLDRGYNPQIPVCRPQSFNRTSNEKNRVDPYLLGVLLGDGCLSGKSITISSHLEDLGHYRGELGSEDMYYGSDYISFKGEKGVWLKEKLAAYGLLGKKSFDKFIPESYKWSSVEDRLSLLQGLMDTDGTSSRDKNACSYTTISEELANDVAFVVRSLGGIVTIGKKDAGYKDEDGEYVECNDAFCLYIRFPDPDDLFRMARKKHGVFGKNLVQKCVTDVRITGKIRGRCITVSNPNGLYITNDFIVTHNSWTGCTWLLFMCILYPNTNWFMGRKELKRITESTLKTFFKVCREYGFTDYKYNAQKYFIKFGNGSNIDLLELKYLPSDMEYERFGSTEYTGGWIDEIAEIDFGAFDVLRTRIGRHMNTEYKIAGCIFATCNPTKGWPKKYFYDPSLKGRLLDHQKFLQSLVTDNPFIDDGYIERLERTTDQSKRERLLKGNWEYDNNSNALCSYDDILGVFENDHLKTDGKYYLTADIARLGSDKAVVLVWEGWKVVDYRVYDISLTTEIQTCINDFRYTYQIKARDCVADQDGVGGGVVDNCGIEGFQNNAAAKRVTLADGRIMPNYKNYQTQCAYMLAEKIREGQIYIQATIKPKYKDEIIEEFGQLQSWKTDDDAKVYIKPKKEIKKDLQGRSPDWRDAFLMRAHFELRPSGDYFIVGL